MLWKKKVKKHCPRGKKRNENGRERKGRGRYIYRRIKTGLKKMKKGKSQGPGKLPVEAWIALRKKMCGVSSELLQQTLTRRGDARWMEE